MLKRYYERIDRKFPFDNNFLELKSIARWEMAKKSVQIKGLENYLKHFNESFIGIPHQSLWDVTNTIRLFQLILKDMACKKKKGK
jgi:inhibitor of KinA sporulation pathway (predicted exonuclease)